MATYVQLVIPSNPIYRKMHFFNVNIKSYCSGSFITNKPSLICHGFINQTVHFNTLGKCLQLSY